MDQAVSVLDDVRIVKYGTTNHSDDSQMRIFFKTKALNATKTMVELHRDQKMTVKLEDGRTGSVLLAHSSLDSEGNAVGVLRMLGDLS
ncbi:MAG: hypothetical protein KF753_19915 [Caldilineaceae bacterium]|nr:hypothetical protein [Caldilineaceae bacterium]